MKNCLNCDKDVKKHKSRRDERYYEGKELHEYIYCWWCDSLLKHKVDGKLVWSINDKRYGK